MKKQKKPHDIHEHCPSVIMWSMNKDSTLRAGLYCSRHAKWIKWLPKEEYAMAVDMGIPELGIAPSKKTLVKEMLKEYDSAQ
jgi:hypothetical protein